MVGMFLRRGVLHTPLYRPRRGRRIIWGFIVYSSIPCGIVVGRMQYAPTRVHVFDRCVVGMLSGRGVLHTSLDHTQRKRAIIRRFLIYPFIPYGMFVGRMLLRPTRVHAFDRCVVRVFLRSGVLHTPIYHTQRKRAIIRRFLIYPFIPCGMFVGRMQYATTTVRAFDRWIVMVFLGRDVLHTPLDHTQRKRTIIWGFMGYTIIPCEMVIGRMQYAPTTVCAFDRCVVRVFLRRGVLYTPIYHTQ